MVIKVYDDVPSMLPNVVVGLFFDLPIVYFSNHFMHMLATVDDNGEAIGRKSC